MNTILRPLALPSLLVFALTGVLMLLPEPERAAQSSATVSRPEPGTPVVISDVRLFDGEIVIEDATVVFNGGRVSAAGADVKIPDGAKPIDGRGRTLLPGFIDSHVHTFGPARTEALRFGVTTLLDMFRPPFDLPEAREQRQRLDATDKADLFSAGYLATAAGGHGTQYGIDVPIPESPDGADAWVAARHAEGSDWIKIVIEDGSAFGGDRPTLDRAMVSALVDAAHARDLLAVAHVSTAAGARMAIEAGVDGLVHLFADNVAEADLIDRARDAGIFVVPTASVIASAMGGPSPDWIAGHPTLGPRLGPMQRQSLEQSFPGANARAGNWPLALQNILAFHQAGIPILAGSDAPNVGTAHGASMHQELRLLVDAGITPLDALRAATSVPAMAFGLEQRGCLQPGCRADALLVDGNPLDTIGATAELVAIWKNGNRLESETAPASAPRATASAEPLNLLDQRQRWMPAGDEFMGGQSRADIEWQGTDGEPVLNVHAQLESGFAFPYAGAMWSAAEIPMQPVDHSGHRRVVVELVSDAAALELMVFSGEGQGAPPVRRSLATGQRQTIEFDDLAGVDASALRAIGVFATGDPAETRFTVRELRLE